MLLCKHCPFAGNICQECTQTLPCTSTGSRKLSTDQLASLQFSPGRSTEQKDISTLPCPLMTLIIGCFCVEYLRSTPMSSPQPTKYISPLISAKPHEYETLKANFILQINLALNGLHPIKLNLSLLKH